MYTCKRLHTQHTPHETQHTTQTTRHMCTICITSSRSRSRVQQSLGGLLTLFRSPKHGIPNRLRANFLGTRLMNRFWCCFSQTVSMLETIIVIYHGRPSLHLLQLPLDLRLWQHTPQSFMTSTIRSRTQELCPETKPGIHVIFAAAFLWFRVPEV